MGFKEWWNKLGKEEYAEEYEDGFKEASKLSVKIFNVKAESDTEEILGALQTGKVIALINSKNVNDGEELKKIIQKVKEASEAKEGKIVGLQDKWFLVTPKEVEISKNQEPSQAD